MLLKVFINKIAVIFHSHLCLVAHIFTQLSKNVCLINTHILVYQHARYDCKLWSAFKFYCVFWLFLYNIIDYSCLKNFISIKLSQIVCLISIDMLKCQTWLQVMKSLLILLRFAEFCTKLTRIFMSEVLYLHQTFINSVFDVNINV